MTQEGTIERKPRVFSKMEHSVTVLLPGRVMVRPKGLTLRSQQLPIVEQSVSKVWDLPNNSFTDCVSEHGTARRDGRLELLTHHIIG